jgi:hypothetical protein
MLQFSARKQKRPAACAGRCISRRPRTHWRMHAQSSSVCEADYSVTSASRYARYHSSMGARMGHLIWHRRAWVKHRECGRWQGERMIIVRIVGGRALWTAE